MIICLCDQYFYFFYFLFFISYISPDELFIINQIFFLASWMDACSIIDESISYENMSKLRINLDDELNIWCSSYDFIFEKIDIFGMFEEFLEFSIITKYFPFCLSEFECAIADRIYKTNGKGTTKESQFIQVINSTKIR